MTMHTVLHSRDDINRLYASRKEGGRELASTEDSVDASTVRLEDYIKKSIDYIAIYHIANVIIWSWN